MNLPLASGRVYVHELLDLVAATNGQPESIEKSVRDLYDWHYARSIAGMQLTFGPVAAGVLAIVAKPGSTVVVVGGSLLVLIALALGVVQLLALNWLHGEYILALRLAEHMRGIHSQLVLYPDAIKAPEQSIAGKLYKELGAVSMVAYRADDKRRRCVLDCVAKYSSGA